MFEIRDYGKNGEDFFVNIFTNTLLLLHPVKAKGQMVRLDHVKLYKKGTLEALAVQGRAINPGGFWTRGAVHDRELADYIMLVAAIKSPEPSREYDPKRVIKTQESFYDHEGNIYPSLVGKERNERQMKQYKELVALIVGSDKLVRALRESRIPIFGAKPDRFPERLQL